jgi:hypothetical protein
MFGVLLGLTSPLLRVVCPATKSTFWWELCFLCHSSFGDAAVSEADAEKLQASSSGLEAIVKLTVAQCGIKLSEEALQSAQRLSYVGFVFVDKDVVAIEPRVRASRCVCAVCCSCGCATLLATDTVARVQSRRVRHGHAVPAQGQGAAGFACLSRWQRPLITGNGPSVASCGAVPPPARI